MHLERLLKVRARQNSAEIKHSFSLLKDSSASFVQMKPPDFFEDEVSLFRGPAIELKLGTKRRYHEAVPKNLLTSFLLEGVGKFKIASTLDGSTCSPLELTT